MSMPIDLILVRHGQSEQNLASKFSKLGDSSLYTDEFRDRPASHHRLTERGQNQARQAGKWLQKHGLDSFERRYVSDYVRAKETAALLNVNGSNWYVDHMLREREWGEYDNKSHEERERLQADHLKIKETDPFYWIPPNGESIAQMTVRLRQLFDTLHRECSDMRVIIVCHGEVMSAFRQMIERMPVDRWAKLEQSNNKQYKIHNCQIFHYSRRDPDTGLVGPHLNWARSVCPWDESLSSNDWKVIERKRFSDKQLLEFTKRTKRLFEGVKQPPDW